MGMMTMWMMAMTHRMMKMKITPIVVSCAAWPGEAEASESTRLTLLSAENDCMRLSNGVAWRARSGWGVEGGVVPNEPPYNPRGPDSDGDAQALPPGSTGRHGAENLGARVRSRSAGPLLFPTEPVTGRTVSVSGSPRWSGWRLRRVRRGRPPSRPRGAVGSGAAAVESAADSVVSRSLGCGGGLGWL
jgi:hypothetical protein